MARPKIYSKKLAKRLEMTEKSIAKMKLKQSEELYKERKRELRRIEEEWRNLKDPKMSML